MTIKEIEGIIKKEIFNLILEIKNINDDTTTLYRRWKVEGLKDGIECLKRIIIYIREEVEKNEKN